MSTRISRFNLGALAALSLAALLTVALDPALALFGLIRPGPVTAALFGQSLAEPATVPTTRRLDPDFDMPEAASESPARQMWRDTALDDEMRHAFVVELAMAEIPPTLETTEEVELPFGAQVPEPGTAVPFALAVLAAFSRRWRGRR